MLYRRSTNFMFNYGGKGAGGKKTAMLWVYILIFLVSIAAAFFLHIIFGSLIFN